MPRLLLYRRVLISAAVIAGLLAVALWPRPVPVDLAIVRRGPLVVTVDEEGVTRVRDRFIVSQPVTGRVLRIELEPGDVVRRGQIVARVRAEVPPLLDERTRAEAAAAVESARAALGRARAEEQRARTTVEQLDRDLVRIRELAASRVVSLQELEAREAAASLAGASVNAAVFAVQVATSELQRALARLKPVGVGTAGRVIPVYAPADGAVLKRIRESESMVVAGEALLEIGDPRCLEIVSDLLSTDAVRVRPGARAVIEQWGDDTPITARVRRVEPAGFTKISALGVEEQRVNVVLDLVESSAATMLGDAYRVEVRIVTWEATEVLKVPTSALFREGGRWAVYRVEDGRARRTFVQLGHQTGQEAEVTADLCENDSIVLHPRDTLKDGVRVKPDRRR